MVDVKICGLSSFKSIDAAIEAGADLVGLVFYSRRPRHVSVRQAKTLADHARGRAKIVALIVDADDAALQDINKVVAPDLYQAHGSETPQRVLEISDLTGRPVIKAIKVGNTKDIAKAADYAGKASLILYDAKAPETLVNALPGGNGLAFDWNLLGSSRQSEGFILSGGLSPDNVAKAIRITGAPIVDVSSGVNLPPAKRI